MKYYFEIPEVWATEILDENNICDGYWISSLTQSWQRGYPDNCTLPWTVYVDLVRRLRKHTNKEIIVDVDMLFNEPSVGSIICEELFQAGCNQVVIESKRFPKVNSLTPEKMVLNTPEEFCRIINKVKSKVPNLHVSARLEYLAVSKDIQECLTIAERCSHAGADSIVVHWGGGEETTILKDALKLLKSKSFVTGIIPTKFLDEVYAGDFNSIADFSILGNITSSFIRDAFSSVEIDNLIQYPSKFKPLLDWASSKEPEGQNTLVVLGAKPDKLTGKYALDDPNQLNKFKLISKNYFKTIFVTSNSCTLDILVDDTEIVYIENSIGELHSLTAALQLLNTEFTTICYADIDLELTELNLGEEGIF